MKSAAKPKNFKQPSLTMRKSVKILTPTGTPFQMAVWRAIRLIPYGQTRSYQWIAKKIGNPKAVRAVGQACGANPTPILVPCHRVVGSGGRLGGFSRGLRLKRQLLRLERQNGNRLK
ncbi:MAG: MGMT family protein [Deltaproteobacteria bacterium]|nr:MGMT family protein [Deltaproteobacteria bacterium]